MKKTGGVPGFAPSDPTDNRNLLDWQTRYKDGASEEIRFEAIYLGCLLAGIPWLLLAFFCHKPQALWSLIDPSLQSVITRYGIAWIAGTLGGTLFAIKWLYHVVAKELWNLDRRLWRLFTPHISGGLAFATVALVSSGILRMFDPGAMSHNSVVVALAFLVGYFSDSAVAKLTEISEALFGTARNKTKSIPEVASFRRLPEEPEPEAEFQK